MFLTKSDSYILPISKGLKVRESLGPRRLGVSALFYSVPAKSES